MGAIRQLLTNENSRNAAFASPGKQIVTRDTRLRGFYRLDGAACSAYYCQADCKDPLGRHKTIRRRIDNVQLIDVTHGYAGQKSILLDTLITEQERISYARIGSAPAT